MLELDHKWFLFVSIIVNKKPFYSIKNVNLLILKIPVLIVYLKLKL